MQRENVFVRCLELVLRPIAGFCLRNSLGLPQFFEAAKQAFIWAAHQELTARGEKVTLRRISMMSGVHRKDVSRIEKYGEVKKEASHYGPRVISRWRRDTRFQTPSGRPRVLTCKGEKSEFKQLVQLESKEINPGTVLLDLERVGAVKRLKSGLKLISRSFVSREDWIEGFELMASDAEALLAAVTENLEVQEEDRPHFHATTTFDNIDPEDLPLLQKWFMKQCSTFHRKVEDHIANYDLDFTPHPNKKGGERFTYVSFTWNSSETSEESE